MCAATECWSKGTCCAAPRRTSQKSSPPATFTACQRALCNTHVNIGGEERWKGCREGEVKRGTQKHTYTCACTHTHAHAHTRLALEDNEG
mmetsp:Transcript_40680/g.65472  ORF Transcript_40680/g.65472 Transcript_40680/m.65472 type:complete len:90 (-) Transcript_40680:136-405(-)